MITIVLIGKANACYEPHMSWHIRFFTDRVQADDNIVMITHHVFDDQTVDICFTSTLYIEAKHLFLFKAQL